jgi:tetrapyrrole methylase family protein/MazG family protein
VFGSASISSSDELVEMWEAAKKAEKGRDSIMDGIPAALPALLYALKVQKKAATTGVGPLDPASARADLATRLDAFDATPGPDALGDVLFAVVEVARGRGIDAEDALRLATARFRSHFESIEVTS